MESSQYIYNIYIYNLHIAHFIDISVYSSCKFNIPVADDFFTLPAHEHFFCTFRAHFCIAVNFLHMRCIHYLTPSGLEIACDGSQLSHHAACANILLAGRLLQCNNKWDYNQRHNKPNPLSLYLSYTHTHTHTIFFCGILNGSF